MSEPTWRMERHSSQLGRQLSDLQRYWSDAAARRIQSKHLQPREVQAAAAVAGLSAVQAHGRTIAAHAKSIDDEQEKAIELFTAIEADLAKIADEEQRSSAHADQSAQAQRDAADRIDEAIQQLGRAGSRCGASPAIDQLRTTVQDSEVIPNETRRQVQRAVQMDIAKGISLVAAKELSSELLLGAAISRLTGLDKHAVDGALRDLHLEVKTLTAMGSPAVAAIRGRLQGAASRWRRRG